MWGGGVCVNYHEDDSALLLYCTFSRRLPYSENKTLFSKHFSSKFHLVFMLNHFFNNLTIFHPFTWRGGAVPSI